MEAWPPALDGLRAQPTSFAYLPTRPGRHPLGDLSPNDLPWMNLDWVEGADGFGSDFSTRSVLVGFGSREGAANLGGVLLDAGNPENPDDEYNLECEGGFRGVGAHSAELNLWLPGSFRWTKGLGLG